MFTNLKNQLLKALPSTVQTKIKKYRNKLFHSSIIKNWEQKGKPVPPPHVVKQDAIKSFQEKYQCKIFVETGTFYGDMVEAQRKNFQQIFSIELNNNLCLKARKRFEKYPHIEILEGDSGKVLYELAPKLKSNTLFWLDGHYSAGVTSKGDKECPIFEEIDAILKDNKKEHVILIDDGRCFVGAGDYPTIEELKNFVTERDKRYQMNIEDDIIRFYIN